MELVGDMNFDPLGSSHVVTFDDLFSWGRIDCLFEEKSVRKNSTSIDKRRRLRRLPLLSDINAESHRPTNPPDLRQLSVLSATNIRTDRNYVDACMLSYSVYMDFGGRSFHRFYLKACIFF